MGKKFVFRWLWLGWLLMPCLAASGQTVVSLGNDSLCAPGLLQVPVSVTQFNGVAGFTFTITFDANVLVYDTILSVHPDLLAGFALYTSPPASNPVEIVYFGLNPLNLGSDTLFYLQFQLLGGSTALDFSFAPPGSELIDASALVIPGVNFVSGQVYQAIPPPILALPPAISTFCEGETAVLSIMSPAANSYLWQYADTTAGSIWQDAVGAGFSGGLSADLSFVAANANKARYYRCIVSSFCSDTTAPFLVLVHPTPQANAGPDQTITQGQSALLSGSGGPPYAWSTGATTQSISVSPLVTTTYFLTVSNGICHTVDTVTITVLPLSAITLEVGSFTACGDTVYVPIIAHGIDSVAALGFYIQVTPSNANISNINYLVDIHPGFFSPFWVVHTNTLGFLNIQWTNYVGPTPFTGTDTLFKIRLVSQGGTYQFNWNQILSFVNYDLIISYPLNFINGQVTVLPLPAPPLVTGDTVCAGATASLTGTGGGTVHWYDSLVGGNLVFTGSPFHPVTAIPGSYNYYASIVDSNACESDRVMVPLLVYELPQVTAGNDTTIQYGDPVILHAQASGGLPPLSFQWQPAALLIMPTQALTSSLPLTSNQIFDLTVSDSHGCTNNASLTVTVLGGPLQLDSVTVNLPYICQGDSAQLMAHVQGGTGQYAYAWTPAQVMNDSSIVNPMASPSSSITIGLTVSDIITGDTISSQINLDVLPAPQFFTLQNDTVICPGQSIPVILNGSQPGINYTLFKDGQIVSGGISGNGFPLYLGDIADSGFYWVYAQNQTTSCAALQQDTLQLGLYDAPAASIISPGDTLICQGDSILLSAFDSIGWTHQWYHGGNLLPSTGPQALVHAAGTYFVVSTNQHACADTSAPIHLTLSPLPIISYAGSVSACEGDSMQLVPLWTGGIPPILFQWSGLGSSFLSSTTTEQPWFTAPAGSYVMSLEITDSLACKAIEDAIISVLALPLVDAGLDTSILYGTQANLKGSVNPPGTYNYLWSPAGIVTNALDPQTTTLPLMQTTSFALEATDIITSCSAVDSIIVTVFGGPVEITGILITPGTVCPGDTLTLEVIAGNGSGQFTFSWTATTPIAFSHPDSAITSITPNAPLTISILVTDTMTGFSVDSTFTVVVYPKPLVMANSNQVCTGDTLQAEGIVSSSTQGPYAFEWFGPGGFNGTGNPINRFPANLAMNGLYSLILIDAHGCRDTATLNVTVTDTPHIVFIADTLICFGDSAFIDASGTNASAYSWNTLPPVTTSGISVSPSITQYYTLTATSNGCQAVADIQISVIPQTVVDIFDTVCEGYSYNFGGLTLITSGIYDDTLIGANTCDSISRLHLTVNPLPLGPGQTGAPILEQVSACNHDTAFILIINSQPGIEYHLFDTLTYLTYGSPLYGNGDTLVFPIPPAAHMGHYNILAINPLTHCERMYDTVVHILIYPPPPIVITPDTILCAGDSLLITASGGMQYHWNTGETTPGIWIAPLVPTTYTVTVSNIQSCTASAQIFIDIHPPVVANAGPDLTIPYGSDTVISGSASGSPGPYIFNWEPSALLVNPFQAQVATIPLTTPAVFELTAWDVMTGCTATDTMRIFISGGPLQIIQAAANPPAICPGDSSQLEVVVIGGTGNYLYRWDTLGGGTFSYLASPMVYPASSMTFQVIVSDSFASDTALVDILIWAPPIALAWGSDTACLGDIIPLYASGGIMYQWDTLPPQSNDTMLWTVTGTGNIPVIVYDTNGCSDTASVYIHSLPTPHLTIFNTSPICEGDTFFLLSDFNPANIPPGPYTYGWYGPLGFTSNLYDVLVPASDTSRAGYYTFHLRDGNGCLFLDSTLVMIFPAPVVGMSGIALEYCENDPVDTLQGYSTQTGQFTGPGINDLGNSTAYFYPGIAGPGMHAIRYGAFGPNGCYNDTVVEIMVHPVAPAQFSGLAPAYCSTYPIDTLYGTPAQGIFNGPGITNIAPGIALFDPGIPTPGTGISISYSYTTVNGCSDDTVMSTTIFAPPLVDAGPDLTIPYGSDTILYGNASGAPGPFLYSWQPATYVINPFAAQPTTIQLTSTTLYQLFVTDITTGCSALDSMTVFISGGPLQIIQTTANPPAICPGDSSHLEVVVMGGTGNYLYRWDTLGGGTFSYLASPMVYPASSMTFQVIVSDGFSSDTATVGVTVYTPPIAQAWGDAAACTGDEIPLDAAGGVLYQWDTLPPQVSSGIDWTVNATAQIPVIVFDANGCSDTAYVSVTAFPLPTLNISSTSPVCEGDTLYLLASLDSSNLPPLPYIFGWVGPMGFTSNLLNAMIPATTAGMGGNYACYFIDGNGCNYSELISVTINPLPTIGMSGLALAYCENDPVDTLQGYSVLTGLFTGPGITDLGNGSAYFNPGIAGPGFHTIGYGAYGANGCYNDTLVNIQVHWVPTAEVQGLVTSYCSNGIATTIYGFPSGGVFSGPGITNITPGVASFDPSSAGYGSGKQITYTYTSPWGCSDDTTITLTVHHAPHADAGPDLTIAAGSDTILYGSGTGNRLAFTWEPAAWLTNPGIPMPLTQPLGLTTTFILRVTDTLTGCFDLDTMIVTVNASPLNILELNANPSFVCLGDTTQLSVTATGGSGYYTYAWSPAGLLNDATLRQPLASPFITTAFSVTVSDQLTGAMKDTSFSIMVYPKPTVSLVATTVICDMGNIPLSAMLDIPTLAPYSYAWSGPAGFTATVHDTILSGVSFWATGLYNLTVTDARGCSGTDTATITVWPNPVSSLTADTHEVCVDGPLIALTPAPGMGWFIGPGVTGSDFDPALAGPGIATLGFVLMDSVACMDTAYVQITVHPLPSPYALTGGGSYCAADSGVHLGLAGSQPQVLYELIYNGTTTGLIIPGNGGALDFGLYSLTGIYRVFAFDTLTLCSDTLPGQLVISIIQNPVADAGSDTSLCAGTSVPLLATGGTSYQWSPAASLNNAAIPNPIASPLTTTWYHLTVTENGCPAYDSVLVTVYPLPVAGISPGSTICQGDSVQLLASGGTSYQWSPATGLSSTTAANPWASPNSTTSYTVTVSSNGCTSTASVTIQVTTLSGTTITADTSICSGQQIVLTAGGGNAYAWSTTPPASTASITVSPASTTTYYVTISQGPCHVTKDVTITVISLPSITLSGDTAICAGDAVQLSAGGGTTYQWSPPTGLNAVNIPNPTASPADTTRYFVTVTANGCSAVDSVEIFVIPLPMAYAGQDTSVCAGDTVWLQASGGDAYSWSPGTGLSDPFIPNPYALVNTTTEYTVQVSRGQCFDYDTITITIVQLPIITISPPLPFICQGDSITLLATGASQFSWNPVTGLSAPTGAIVNAHPAITTTYTVIGQNNFGCIDSTQVVVTVHPLPLLGLQMSDSILCRGDSVYLTASGAAQYFWSPANGLSSSQGANIIAYPTTTTSFILEGVSAQGCVSTRSFTLTVLPRPWLDLGPDRYLCLGEDLTLSAGYISPFVDVIWQDGSNQPTYIVNQPGTYWVLLDNGVCPISDTIEIWECTSIWVPNAFTPDGDGLNDYFTPKASTDLSYYHLLIYNRWGEQVFESHHIDNSWDGSFKGSPSPVGVYHFVLDYIGFADRQVYMKNRKTGYIVLVR